MKVIDSRIPDKNFCLEFTLAIGCRLNCKYCPQEKLIKRYKTLYPNDPFEMSFENFQRCLEALPKGASVAFGGMSEPFHNKSAAKMIRYAYDLGFKLFLATTLVDMEEEDLELIKDVKFLDGIILHIPDNEGNSKFIVNEKYLSLLKKVHKCWDIQYYSCHGTVHEEVAPYMSKEKFQAMKMMNRAGNLEYDELETYHPTGRIRCGSGTALKKSAHTMIVLPNGALVLCCMDYGLEHVVGNLFKESWRDIFSGSEYKKIEAGMDDDSIPILCRQCCGTVPINGNWQEWKFVTYNAVQIARTIENFTRYGISVEYSKKQIDILQRIVKAKNICIFGLGKLFHDNYFLCSWNEVLQANLFSDNNKSNFDFEGTYVVPNELKSYEDLLVITYVRNDLEIRKQLMDFGIHNFINIYDIFNFHVLD